MLSSLSMELRVFPEPPGQVSRPNVLQSLIKNEQEQDICVFLTYLALAKIQQLFQKKKNYQKICFHLFTVSLMSGEQRSFSADCSAHRAMFFSPRTSPHSRPTAQSLLAADLFYTTAPDCSKLLFNCELLTPHSVECLPSIFLQNWGSTNPGSMPCIVSVSVFFSLLLTAFLVLIATALNLLSLQQNA